MYKSREVPYGHERIVYQCKFDTNLTLSALEFRFMVITQGVGGRMIRTHSYILAFLGFRMPPNVDPHIEKGSIAGKKLKKSRKRHIYGVFCS